MKGLQADVQNLKQERSKKGGVKIKGDRASLPTMSNVLNNII